MTVKTSLTINGITLSKSDRKSKKYKAVFNDGTVSHFGHSAYEHYKDSTGVGAWSHRDHGGEKRRANYQRRGEEQEEP